MHDKIKVVEVPAKVHAKVKIYCGKMGFKVKGFVAKVLLDAIDGRCVTINGEKGEAVTVPFQSMHKDIIPFQKDRPSKEKE